MGIPEGTRRVAIVLKARAKFNDLRLALVELNGVFTIKPLSGRWQRKITYPEKGPVVWTALESEKAILSAGSLNELEKLLDR